MHLRNLYILALYENLRRDMICDPFTKAPPSDELPPLSNHLKQLIEKFSAKQATTPDWLETTEKLDQTFMGNTVDYEEDDYIGDLKFTSDVNDLKQNFIMNSEKIFPNKSNEFENSGMLFGDSFKFHNINSDCLKYSNNQIQNRDAKTNDDNINCDWLKHSNNPMQNRDGKMIEDNEVIKNNIEDVQMRIRPNDYNMYNKFQEKEMEKRLVQLQNAYHEDVLKLRNQHDIEIQHIINRKNVEIEQIRNSYKEKNREQEIQMQQLDAKATDCLKQLQMFQETKLKEIEQMKRNHAEILENQKYDHDKKITNLVDDLQKEKCQILEENKKREEILLKESKDYFEKVVNEFTEKSLITNRQIVELESDIVQLKNSKIISFEQNEKLKLEKEETIIENRKLQNDFIDLQKRYQVLETHYNHLLSTHTNEVKSVKDTLEIALHKAECSKDEVEVIAHDKIEKLENQINDLQSKLQDAKRLYKKEIENMNINNNSERNRLKQSYEEDIESLKLQLKDSKHLLESKIYDLERKLDMKEVQLIQVNKELESKEKLALQMVDDLRQEMVHNNDRQLHKKQYEFEIIESELKQEIQNKTKEIIDLMQQLSFHRQETEIKLTEIRKWSDNQILSLTNEWKQEKQSMDREFQSQIAKINDTHKKECEKLEDEKNKKIFEIQSLFESSTREIPILKRELCQQIQNHKKEVNDLILMYENEKLKVIDEHKVIIENLNKQAIDNKSNMEGKHAENISQIMIKTNEKLKEIEDEYSNRSMQSFKMINELKLLIEKLKDDKIKLLNSQEDFKCNLSKTYNYELENMQKNMRINLENYKKEKNNDQIKLKNLERQIEKKDHEIKKQLNMIKCDYETRLSKLMPIDVQSDYEETIQSLRTQISFLLQKIAILEDEVNSNNLFKDYQSNDFSKHKLETLLEL